MNAISELVEAGALNKPILDAVFSIFNVCVSLFGLGVLGYVKARRPSPWCGRLGAWLLIVRGVVGLSMSLFFRMDPHGATATFVGTMHLVTAVFIFLDSVLATLLIGLWLQDDGDLSRYGNYMLVSAAIIFLSGLFTIWASFNATQIFGLAERITAGAFIQWLIVLCLKLFSGMGEAELQKVQING